MNKEEFNQLINDEVEKIQLYCKKNNLTDREYFELERKKKFAIELKEKDNLKKRNQKLILEFKSKTVKLSCLVYSGIKYENDDQEQEYGEIQYKRYRENYLF